MAVPKKTSQSAEPRPVYVIYGPDPFLCSEKLDKLIHHLLGDQIDGMSLSMHDGDAVELADVLDECRTPTLLATTRVVCVKDADGFVSNHRQAMERYIETFLPPEERSGKRAQQAPPPPKSPSGILILTCKSWMKTTRLYKMIEKVGRNVLCAAPRRRDEFIRWVSDHANEAYRCTMGRGAAERLYDLVGDDLGLLNMELSKLATFVSPRQEIQLDEVEALIGSSRMEKVFGITDAIAQHDAKKAISLWEQVLASDRSALYRSIGGLAFGFRRLAEAKRMVAQGATVADAKNRAKLFGDVSSLTRQLKRFSLAQWQDHLVTLLRIDVGSKTGLGNVQTSVEKLIVDLCAAS